MSDQPAYGHRITTSAGALVTGRLGATLASRTGTIIPVLVDGLALVVLPFFEGTEVDVTMVPVRTEI